MIWLLVTDLHLTDNAIESYRWNIFEFLYRIVKAKKVDRILVLGDVVDRKDRHSGSLVNRMIYEFGKLCCHTKVTILAGNHDKPLNGPYYWEFLCTEDLAYITKPTFQDDVWLLPFTANPVEDWKELDLASAKALFMHQTVVGSLVEGGRRIDYSPYEMPALPKIPIFSGDVHCPQDVAGLTYVGTPYPVRFGENWKHRVILIENEDFENYKEIHVPGIKRLILDIKSASELPKLKAGDQVRIRFALANESFQDWPIEQEKIKLWAKKCGVEVVSMEASMIGEGFGQDVSNINKLETMPPEELIRKFGLEKKLEENVISVGIQLLEESI